MPKTAKPRQKQIEPYEHHDKDRLNNPPVGLVNADSDKDAPRKTYAYLPPLGIHPQIPYQSRGL